MTSFGMWLMHWIGDLFVSEGMSRRMYLGFEMMHLIGNAIFLIGIIGLSYFIKSKKIAAAFFIQAFHFYEHVSLTASAVFINKSIGISTFFGMVTDPSFALAYRVWWHFIFNLVPTVLVLMAIFGFYQARKKMGAVKKVETEKKKIQIKTPASVKVPNKVTKKVTVKLEKAVAKKPTMSKRTIVLGGKKK